MNRSKACENYLKYCGVNCCSIKDDQIEPYFSWFGCDCCENGLGTSVYDCIGYDPKAKKVVDIGRVCHDCICYFYNGDDSPIEKRG